MYLRSTPEKPNWICTSRSPLVIGTKHDVHRDIATALENVIRTRMSGSVDEKILWKKYNHPASLPHALQKFRKTGSSSSLSAEIGKFESLNCMVWQKDREEHCPRTSRSSQSSKATGDGLRKVQRCQRRRLKASWRKLLVTTNRCVFLKGN